MLTYAFAMTVEPKVLWSAINSKSVTAAAEPNLNRAAKLAQNHGFLKGLMKRIGKHFQDAGAGAVRMLSSGGVWVALLSTVVAAVSFLFDARHMRHFKLQPNLGKMRALGAGLSFIMFIGAFLTFFKKIAMAWRNESETDAEKAKAEAMLAKLSNAERLAVMARAQAQARKKPATASVRRTPLLMLASILAHEGADVEVRGSGFAGVVNARLRVMTLLRRYSPAQLFHRIVTAISKQKKEHPGRSKLVLTLLALISWIGLAEFSVRAAPVVKSAGARILGTDIKAARHIFANMDWTALKEAVGDGQHITHYAEYKEVAKNFMKQTSAPVKALTHA